MNRSGLAVANVALIVTASCGLFHKKAPSTPAPVITAPPTARSIPKEPPILPPPPKVDPGPTGKVPNPPKSAAQTPTIQPPPVPIKPVKPQKKVRAKVAPPKPPAAAAEEVVQQSGSQSPAAGAQPAPEAAAPQLTQLLSPVEQATYNRAVDAAIGRTNANLSRLVGMKLTPAQQATVERIHAFLRETQEARATDLVTAKSFADRADLLAQDMVKTLNR